MIPSTVRGAAHAFATQTTRDSARARGSLVLVPVGAVEQHGPHLPLGTDIWLASSMASAAAARVDGVLVAEALPIGCSAHHRSFPGTLSLRVETFINLIVDVASTLAADGFVPVFVNGHGGNRAPLEAALQTLLERGVQAWGVTYFELIADAVDAEFKGDRGACGHACALETSLSLSLWPNLVRADSFPDRGGAGAYPDASMLGIDRVVRPRRFEDLDTSGIVGDPSLSSVASGDALNEIAVARLAGVLERIRAEITDDDWNETVKQ